LVVFVVPHIDCFSLVDRKKSSTDFFVLLEGLMFQWQCHTFNTATFQELVAISARPLPDCFDTDCDVISSEVSPGMRMLNVAEGVSAVGYLFQVGVR
jgi:hypothetical protein